MAQALHVHGKDVAKPVLVRTKHGYALAVLPATCRVDLQRLRDDLGEDVELATEDEVERIFTDCERGVRPPFGSLYHLPTIVDEALTKDERIVFEGPNHEEALRMSYHDFDAVEHPRTGRFAAWQC
jgi:Ala-tRNA(Pro) deacylase